METLLADSRFVDRALGAELGHGADGPAKQQLLREYAATPWTAQRLAAELDRLLGPGAMEPTPEMLAAGLRRLRRRALLGVIARDTAGVAPLSEVVGSMTALAELAVQRALAVHARDLARAFGVPQSATGAAQDLLVVAMGKGGGGELNVSSDLDLVFVYDEEGTTRAFGEFADAQRSLSNQEFFERLGRRLNGALSDANADGFVFRVDMRLRPNGDSGPLVVSDEMLEEYLIRQGREWERFAWLKGRVISQPVFADADAFALQRRAFESIVQPFVFRKYLDFGAIAALRDLHALIRAETRRKSARRARGHDNHEDNVKLGRGGIREIEFIAQSFQIVRGGRDARLRDRSTLRTLALLGMLGLLAPDICDRLAAAYEFLRRLEHALQYVDDAQTHLVPGDGTARERIARLMRVPSAGALMEQFEQTREFVATTFDAVFARAGRAAGDAHAPLTGEAATQRLALLGYRQPAESGALVETLLNSRRVVASDASRRAVERLLAGALEPIVQVAGAATPPIAPDKLLARFVRLLDVVAGRTTYLALLAQYPQAFARVLRLLAASRWATDYLVRHPILLDELLDDRLTNLSNATPVDFSAWRADVEHHLADLVEDTERAMNVMRDAHHAQVFRLLVADLDGRLSVERLADHLSALADCVLEIVLRHVWKGFNRKHRDDPRFAAVAYGKLGGKELGYASDLDLIFLFDDEHADAAEIYALFARRLVNWLTVRTSSGTLFEIDLRLRPNGNAGLLVSERGAFERYQRNEDGRGAWPWEHQALTRARYCAGERHLGAAFEDLRNEVLARSRDERPLRDDVLAMRRRMHDGHPNRTRLFDLKHDPGGMVDIEFIVQYLVLAHAHAHPRLLGNLGNIALLGIAGELGLVDAALARAVADAYRTYRRLQHGLRLNAEAEESAAARVEPERVRAEVQDVRALWGVVFGTDDAKPA
ncbi:MAG TPA: bifunctional [glutamate--ammonia ligase]-adenylyl-L-tyrosine phosphorylase/[glutamate--ammonia-ligase] adenylyltransferase [Burkholderiaceae bacterium]|nr:bifunctional [glutamate--ammonia ligase]-adenylyl-L-tyrosine phosphorylase/[glutamate--ammonia-ligase] adenylyltransferase [Burkholderiaceae bacterium]